MKVNFNNLRRQAVVAYNQLAMRLNDAKCPPEGVDDFIDGFGRTKKDTIIIEAEDIDDIMNDLRSMIGSIAMTYQEGDGEFKDIYSEMYPEEQDKRMVIFNEEIDSPTN